jgi:hypothetical protein
MWAWCGLLKCTLEKNRALGFDYQQSLQQANEQFVKVGKRQKEEGVEANAL